MTTIQCISLLLLVALAAMVSAEYNNYGYKPKLYKSYGTVAKPKYGGYGYDYGYGGYGKHSGYFPAYFGFGFYGSKIQAPSYGGNGGGYPPVPHYGYKPVPVYGHHKPVYGYQPPKYPQAHGYQG